MDGTPAGAGAAAAPHRMDGIEAGAVAAGRAAGRYPPGMGGTGTNPFRPGRGVLPPLLAGREHELDMAEKRLAALARGESPAEDLLFYGPRGNGKTALLLEIERRARNRDFRVETLPVDTLTDRAVLVRALQERAGVPGGEFTSVRLGGSGVTEHPPAPTDDIHRLFASWVGAGGARPTVIALDEVQALDADTARPFFEAIQEAKSGPAPFLVLAAGTPDARRRIREAATFNERGFEPVPVGRLQRSDTTAALTEPARAAGRPIARDALALLAEQSQDHPYFVQLLGSAAWRAATRVGADGISPAAATQGMAECGTRIERFYEDRYQEARTRRVAPVLKPLARLVAENDGRVTESQLESLLRTVVGEGAVPFDDLALEQELSDLGVVWSMRPGVWEMGIPSFADYVLGRG